MLRNRRSWSVKSVSDMSDTKEGKTSGYHRYHRPSDGSLPPPPPPTMWWLERQRKATSSRLTIGTNLLAVDAAAIRIFFANSFLIPRRRGRGIIVAFLLKSFPT